MITANRDDAPALAHLHKSRQTADPQKTGVRPIGLREDTLDLGAVQPNRGRSQT